MPAAVAENRCARHPDFLQVGHQRPGVPQPLQQITRCPLGREGLDGRLPRAGQALADDGGDVTQVRALPSDDRGSAVTGGLVKVGEGLASLGGFVQGQVVDAVAVRGEAREVQSRLGPPVTVPAGEGDDRAVVAEVQGDLGEGSQVGVFRVMAAGQRRLPRRVGCAVIAAFVRRGAEGGVDVPGGLLRKSGSRSTL